jgi:RNA-splicing ligase RtcB
VVELNHYIEVGKSISTNEVWITIHTGSRNFGKKICEYWQDVASKKDVVDVKVLIDEIKSKYPSNEWNTRIKEIKENNKKYVKNELDWLDGDNKEGYLCDMKLAQEYASLNRKTIMNDILSVMSTKVLVKEVIETIHNYISFDDNIIRKGSVRSYIGEKFLLPFNMVDGMLICEGKSNPDWNYSAPHGAGRIYSRSMAKKLLDVGTYKEGMDEAGIYSSVIGYDTIDESREAYKDAKMIEEAIEPTAKVLDRIKPILNMKAGKDR